YLRLVAPLALALLLSLVLTVVTAWLLGPGAAALVALLLGLSLLSATWALHRRTGTLAAQRVTRLESLRRLALEHLEANAELTAAGARSRHRARLLGEADGLSAEQRLLDQRTAWHGAVASLCGHLPVVVVLWFGVSALQAEAIAGPMIVLLALALLGLNEAIQGLPEAFGRLGGTLAAAQRLNTDTAGPELPEMNPVPDNKHEGAWGLAFESVTIAHEGLPPLLRDWSLRLQPGSRTGLVGASGCGKSSLADLAAGLEEPAAGLCVVSQGMTRGESAGQRLARVSYLTQNTQLLEDTLRENLRLGRPDADDHTLWQVLDAVALTGLVERLRYGLDTWLGPHGYNISGGEARRVALARALLRPAPILVLDEPFTGLDRATRDAVCLGIEPYLAGRTLLALGHDPSALPPVDRIIRL
ncbi:MAG: ATP-binding cassette domain-containing protein, partial [Marinobacter sp.]|uniref:amino acid ABC transporter ATP-binding/permease protein n=1 Tax=Marinobacter sp. TaxID=50741 RepID=UPI00299DE69B